MYITAVPNRHSPPAILLRESFRDGDQVRTRTLANLTSWAPERIEALRRALKGEFDGLTGELQPVCGPIFAVLFALKQLAEPPREVRRHPEPIRYTFLAAFCWQRRQEIIDGLVDLLIQIVHRISVRAEKKVVDE